MAYRSSGLYRRVKSTVSKRPPPRSAIWFPSMTDASVSRKKLQWTLPRPSSAPLDALEGARKRKWASQRCATSWPRISKPSTPR